MKGEKGMGNSRNHKFSRYSSNTGYEGYSTGRYVNDNNSFKEETDTKMTSDLINQKQSETEFKGIDDNANARYRGKVGEFNLSTIMDVLPEGFHCINNVLLDTTNRRSNTHGAQETSTQIDHIVICKYGIFVIETKNYKGWIYGDWAGSVWTQVLYNGAHNTFYSPVKQNQGHVINLAKQIKLTTQNIFGLIVFTSVKADMLHVNYPYCLSLDRLYEYFHGMCNFATQVYTEEQVWKIIKRIDAVNKSGYVNDMKHTEFVKQQKKMAEERRMAWKAKHGLM